MLCSNFKGSEKLKPVVIGKHKMPRCFKSFNIGKYVEYISSDKVWITQYIFNQWLGDRDLKMKLKNRKIILLLDNCPAHKVNIKITHIELMYLPKNSTGILQPIDLGIIKYFKTFFNQYKLNDIINNVEKGFDVYESYKNINLKDAIIYTDYAWKIFLSKQYIITSNILSIQK
ncbi:Tigger transposable element-derived protein 6 [Dictyocoela muelleri]|nr:Tigger transposable element-derived protein 6 [Dictyocoela muelleri]